MFDGLGIEIRHLLQRSMSVLKIQHEIKLCQEPVHLYEAVTAEVPSERPRMVDFRILVEVMFRFVTLTVTHHMRITASN